MDDLPINKLLRGVIDTRSSELHLQVGKPAIFRIKGKLTPLDMMPLDEEKTRELCLPLMDELVQQLAGFRRRS